LSIAIIIGTGYLFTRCSVIILLYIHQPRIHPYELVFGRKPNIPSAFYKEPEAQYNYDNYVLDLKRMMQEAHKIARNNLITKKETKKKIL